MRLSKSRNVEESTFDYHSESRTGEGGRGRPREGKREREGSREKERGRETERQRLGDGEVRRLREGRQEREGSREKKRDGETEVRRERTMEGEAGRAEGGGHKRSTLNQARGKAPRLSG